MSSVASNPEPFPISVTDGEPLLNHADLKAMVREVGALATPPHVYMKAWELLQSSASGGKNFEQVIGLDPSLTLRLHRTANSSFYNLRGRVSTMSRAVGVVYIRELFTLVVAVSAITLFSKITSDLVNMDTFWRHSVFTGAVAKLLTEHCDALHSERVFVAGLLHDIGSLVMFNQLPDVQREFLPTTAGDEEQLYQMELDVLGFTDAQVADILLETWQVPAELNGAVIGHHDPSSVVHGVLEAGFIRVANAIANCSAIGGGTKPTWLMNSRQLTRLCGD